MRPQSGQAFSTSSLAENTAPHKQTTSVTSPISADFGYTVSMWQTLPHPLKNRIGQKFGRWIVLERAPDRTNPKGRPMVFWLCRCDCGTVREVRAGNLAGGQSVSCGCLTREKTSERAVKRNTLRRAENPALNALYTLYRRGADKRNLPFQFSPETFEQITSKHCYFCGCPPLQKITRRGRIYIYNGVDRLDSRLGYTEENSVPSCVNCNRAKWCRTESEFYSWLRRAYEHTRLR